MDGREFTANPIKFVGENNVHPKSDSCFHNTVIYDKIEQHTIAFGPEDQCVDTPNSIVVDTGDTLSSIAKEFYFTVDELRELNPNITCKNASQDAALEASVPAKRKNASKRPFLKKII
jgi:hypothetical protein